ncbi:RNA polymerase sigma factor [Arthrobacter phage Adumb2043]|uniref:DNA binding protein n=1 Tax=Arthrobacter phage Adumb2043 TaxID=2776851 RepID=A0A7M1CL17_9CAUD|nr:RNA polymerase sigma factor [Arthrobacter phage Adumb2043]QOP65102.1 DNA binding protein [Arthrobacter phage Adumb2043]
MNYSKALSDIFSRNAERRFESAEAERDAILAAKRGDEAATLDLMYAYAPALRNGVKWYTRAIPSVDRADGLEEIHSVAVFGLLEAIAAFDVDAGYDRLAATVGEYVANAVAEHAQAVCGLTVPSRTLSRFFAILRKADGNVYDAASLAPKYHMTRETFLAVLSAVRSTSLDAAHSTEENDSEFFNGETSATAASILPVLDAYEAVNQRMEVEAAFAAVDDVEESVCRLAYGFETYGDPVPDGEIGHRLGMTRPTVQRRRASALGKMREALAVE